MLLCLPPRVLAAGLASLCLSASACAQVLITEFDAINCGTLEDADGNEPDWIELANAGNAAVNLAGWALSDDPAVPGQWTFPPVSIPAGGHLVVFASGKDWALAGVEPHTNFKLGDAGESIVLSQPDGLGGWTVVDQILDYPEQKPGVTYGRATETAGSAVGYCPFPTPGATNPTFVASEFVADTEFDVDRGFYDTPFTVTVTCATPGATIVYTLDGSDPGPYQGTAVPAPDAAAPPVATVPIGTTTVLRAMAYKAGMASTDIDTQTYLFPADVLAQDDSYVTQPFANWGHDKADPGSDLDPDWAMDPRVTGHANPEDRCIPSDLEKIPCVSIVLPWDSLFGPHGIYIEGEGVPIPASFEVLNPTGDNADPMAVRGDHAAGAVLVFGGSSTEKRWKTDKLSFRFNFWEKFESAVLGEGAVGDYDRLVLDARLNNVWTQSQNFEQRQFGDYARDAVLSDLELALAQPGVHSQHVHLFLNGLYWGLYTLHERPDNHFAEAYLGGDKDDYDIVKHGPDEENFLVDGLRIDPTQPISNTNHTAGVNYLAMVALAQADLSIPTNYEALAAVLDIPALIDHILLNFYGGNYDWPQHNWYASFNRVDPAGRWRFHCWDAEHVFKYVDYPRFDDVTNKFEGWDRPDGIHLQLLRNPDYRLAFADAAHRYLFNDGPFIASRTWALFEARFDDIDEAIRAESARWGDNGHQNIDASNPLAAELHLRYSNVPSAVPASSIGQSDTTDFASWWHERERLRTQILGDPPNRPTRFLAQLRNAVYGEDHPLEGQPNPLYPQTDAPVFSQLGGPVTTGFVLTLSHPNATGTLYYTTDGSDPRTPGSDLGTFFSGTVNATATAYAAPLSLTATTTVKARVLRAGEWSALTAATFQLGPVVPASAANLVISEIHYHPADPTAGELAAGFTDDGDFEYFEVINIGTDFVSLADLSMDQGLDLEALAGGVETLAPGAVALYVANPAALARRYGEGLPIAGRFIFGTGLSNSGERLHLRAADGSTILDLTYDDNDPWPETPDGDGPSLVLLQPGLRDPHLAWNWRASTAPQGSPAADDSTRWADWTLAHFSATDPRYPAIADPEADADRDGLCNLEEYFLGTDPRVADALAVRPTLTAESLDLGAGPALYAILSFRYARAHEGVIFGPHASGDLEAWGPDPLVLIEPPTVHDDGTETRRYRSAQPINDASAERFFRLRLEAR